MKDINEIIRNFQKKLPEQPISINSWKVKLGKFIYDYLYNDMLIGGHNVELSQIIEVQDRGTIGNYSGNLKTIYELGNNPDLIIFMMKNLAEGAEIDTRLIKTFNKILTRNIMDERKYNGSKERPGEWKKKQYPFGQGEVGAEPEKVLERIYEIIELLNDSSVDPLQAATVAHCAFQNIHPFAQASGRTGRALTNYHLLLRNYPPIVFDVRYKDKYYGALSSFDNDKSDVGLMYDYMLLMIRNYWDTEENNVQVSDALKNLKDRTEEYDG